MITLKEKDKELITTSKVVNYEASDKLYLGGKFGTRDNDYIHLLIHDENENFLESSILNSDDYLFDNEDRFQAKTGTILRKLGYDRGRFVLKFVFLRYVAGSPKTVLIQTNGKIYKEPFNKNSPVDMLRVTGGRGVVPDLAVKEDQYLIDEISGTRTEVRVIPQAIDDIEYIENFNNLRKERNRITTEKFNLAKISFTGLGAFGGNSKRIKFSGVLEDETVGIPDDILTEGKFFIPNAFITSITPLADIYSRGDNITSKFEVEATLPSDIQASFCMTALYRGQETNSDGDKLSTQPQFDGGNDGFNQPRYKFDMFQTYLKDYNNEIQGDPYNSFTGNFANNAALVNKIFEATSAHSSEQIPLNVRRVRKTANHIVNPIFLRENADNGVIFEISSNSALVRQADPEKNVPTKYTWTISGFDWDKGGDDKGWNRLVPGDKGFGDFMILDPAELVDGTTDSPEKYAIIQSNPYSATTESSENGSSILIKVNSWNTYIGIGLSIQQSGTNEGNSKSSVFYPGCVVTARDD